MSRFWNVLKNEDSGTAEIRIDGDIVMEQGFWDWLLGKPDNSATGLLQEIKNLDGEDVDVWINSNGGECLAASVLYTALKNHKGKVTAKVVTAISAASVVAMAGDEILMSPTGIIMIHNPLTYAEGEVKDFEKAIDVLKEVKQTILNAYVSKTGKSREEISTFMDNETWMSAEKAIEMGFADGKLFEDEEESNKYLNGMKKVFNSLSNASKIEVSGLVNRVKSLNQDEQQQKQALNRLEIEKLRYGGM